jgi:hypothetical protein
MKCLRCRDVYHYVTKQYLLRQAAGNIQLGSGPVNSNLKFLVALQGRLWTSREPGHFPHLLSMQLACGLCLHVQKSQQDFGSVVVGIYPCYVHLHDRANLYYLKGYKGLVCSSMEFPSFQDTDWPQQHGAPVKSQARLYGTAALMD